MEAKNTEKTGSYKTLRHRSHQQGEDKNTMSVETYLRNMKRQFSVFYLPLPGVSTSYSLSADEVAALRKKRNLRNVGM